MREAFDVMSTHPLLTFFLGVVVVTIVGIVFNSISKIGKRKN